MLGAQSFAKYINRLYLNVNGLVSNSAETANGVMDGEEDCQTIQWDLDQFQKLVEGRAIVDE